MENPEMNTSLNDVAYSTTEMRRRYPKDNEGIKDEWKALIKHQTDINEMIMRHERELKGLRQQELGQAYNHKLAELIRAKEHELRLKQEEAHMVQLRTEQFKADMLKQQEDKALLQNHLGNEYSNQIANRHHKEMTQREKQMEQERRIVEDAKRRLEDSKRRELMKQEELHNIFNEEIRRAEEKNHRLVEDQMKEKIDYRDNIRENERKQILKEENYRNFFKLSADNQKKLIDLHAQNVLLPHLQKEQQFSDVVEKRIENERQRQYMDEVTRRRMRDEKNKDIHETNKEKMEYKDYLKSMERNEKQLQVQESLRQSLEHQDFLRTMKNQKLDQQKVYKDFLDRQQQEHLERERLNKMTKQEKKINFGDLQAYKGYDPKMFGLIPGFINSKYNHPLGGGTDARKQGNGNGSIYADTLARLQEQRSFDNLPSYQGSPTKGDTSYNSSQNGSPLKDRYETKPDEVIVGSPKYASGNIFSGQEYNTLGKSETYKSLLPSSVRGSHNPITNPLPLNVQNPYLLREIYNISGKKPYFANMASSNLVG